VTGSRPSGGASLNAVAPEPDAQIASSDEVIEQLITHCWPHEAVAGGAQEARRRAGQTLERLLRAGLPHARAAEGSERFDPYAVNRALCARAGEPCDEAWLAWQETARRNLRALDGGPHPMRFRLRREWHALPRDNPRPLSLRLPLPLREPVRNLSARLLEPAGALVSLRQEPGRLELRVHPSAARAPVAAEVAFELDARDSDGWVEPASASEDGDALWLAPREGAAVCSPRIAALAATLAAGAGDARPFLAAAWDFLFSSFRFGDVHRAPPGAADPLAAALDAGWVDCALGASLLIALCRARGIPARLVSGYLLAPGLPAFHSWAEVRLAPARWAPMDLAGWEACGGDARDPVWGQLFFGRLNPRATCEIAPRQFTGWGSARPPRRWLKLHRLAEGGLEQSLRALPGGELVQRDRVWAEKVSRAPADRHAGLAASAVGR